MPSPRRRRSLCTALRPKGSDSLVGSVLADRYHILKRIGEGGMGRVYLGEHVKMNRQCAIKVMSPALVNDAGAAGASGTGYVVPAGQSTAIVNQEPAAASAGGRTLSTAGVAGIGTGIALLITGAGFVAVQGKRRPHDPGLSPA